MIELGTGNSGSASGDAGIIIERGDDNNVFIGWDESADQVQIATTTATGASSGDLTLTDANLKAGTITYASLSDGAITITANTFDYDMSAGGTAATGTIGLADSGGNDGDSDTVTITGNNGIVVSNTSTSALLVENKGAQHTVTVAGGKFVIDGTSQQALRLVPGVIYWFDQSDSSNGSHPLHFSTTSDGTHNSGSQLTEGTGSGFIIYEKVGTPGSAGAYTRIKLQQDAGNIYYYYCANILSEGTLVNKTCCYYISH